MSKRTNTNPRRFRFRIFEDGATKTVDGEATRATGTEIVARYKDDSGTWDHVVSIDRAEDAEAFNRAWRTVGGQDQELEWDDGTPLDLSNTTIKKA